MIRIFDYNVTSEWNGKTILSFLNGHGYSRGVIVHLKKTPESILLNGIWEYVNATLCKGDTLRIILSEEDSSENITPLSLPLEICYEDEDILIVNKPAEMPIHPSQGHHSHTLANSVCGYFEKQGIPYTFRCVNRLDKGTTGLVLVAKHMLSSALSRHNIKRQALHSCRLEFKHPITGKPMHFFAPLPDDMAIFFPDIHFPAPF